MRAYLIRQRREPHKSSSIAFGSKARTAVVRWLDAREDRRIREEGLSIEVDAVDALVQTVTCPCCQGANRHTANGTADDFFCGAQTNPGSDLAVACWSCQDGRTYAVEIRDLTYVGARFGRPLPAALKTS